MNKKEYKPFISIDRKSIALLAILFFAVIAGAKTDIGDNIVATWVNATFFKGDGGNITGLNASLASKGTLAETRFPTNYNATQVYNVKAFGAKGDGGTNDTAIIQSALNFLSNGDTLYFPNGTYVLGANISATNKTIRILGDGINKTNFLATFVAGDILTVGDKTLAANTYYPEISGIGFFTNVTRTSGYAIRMINPYFGRISNVAIIDKSPVSGQNHANGIAIQGFDNSFIDHVLIQTRQNGTTDNGVGIGLAIYGTALSGAGLFVSDSRLVGTGDCIVVGGGTGGVSIRETDMSVCRENGIRIDRSMYAGVNSQVFMSKGASVDGAGTGILLNESGSYLDMTGAWSSSSQAQTGNFVNATGIGIRVVAGNLFVTGGSTINNNAADGVKIEGGAMYIEGNYIQNNVKYGVNQTVGYLVSRVVGNNYMSGNTAGNLNGSMVYGYGGTTELRSGSMLRFRPTANDYNFDILASGFNLDFVSGGGSKVSIGSTGFVNLSTTGKGITMRSPDGTFYCLTIANGGTTAVGAGACS